jgi:hypothetical protein
MNTALSLQLISVSGGFYLRGGLHDPGLCFSVQIKHNTDRLDKSYGCGS